MIDDYIVKSLKLLNKVHSESDECSNVETSLIYPQKIESKKKESSKRISEQEAKILFCHILLQDNVAFSVETPTIGKYSFTGNTKISGNLDLCIYKREEKLDLGKEFEALCVDMESGAVAQVCYLMNVKFLIIRSISDSVTDESSMEYDKFAELAAENSKKILKKIIN